MKNEFDCLNRVSVDFSKYEEVQLSEKELESMKNIVKTPKGKKKIRRGAVVGLAACAAVVAAFSLTAFGKELIGNIIKTVSTGRNSFSQYDPEGEFEIPKTYRIFYDKDGNLLTTYSDGTVLYDKDGNVIEDAASYAAEMGALESETDGKTTTITVSALDAEARLDEMERQGYTVLRDEKELSELDKALDFDYKLPSYLPDGISFAGACYFDSDGKYLFLFYADRDGNYIVIDQRLLNEETAVSMGTDGIVEEARVNGRAAALCNEQSLNWEDGDVAVGVNVRNALNKDELFKIAEGME